jgi:RNA polymerase-binding protein DksA
MPRNPLQPYIDSSAQFTELTRDRAEKIVKKLVKAGAVNRKKAGDVVDELVERSRANAEALVAVIHDEVLSQLASLESVTKDAVERLEEQVEALRAQVQELVAASATSVRRTTSTRPAPATKAPPKKAPAKKAPAKKAPAKKAPAKKAPAKKVTKAPAKKAPTTKKTAAKKSTAKKTAAKKTVSKSATTATAAKKASALKVKEGEGAWTKAEIKEVLDDLHHDRERVTRALADQEAELVGLMRDAGDGAGHDQADMGATSFERDHELTVLNNEREKLAQIDRALARIDNGTYGICESCGNPIGKMRAMAFPRATLCLTCKQREERR